MPTVHVFASCGQVHSEDALQRFVRPTYSKDGDQIDSAFMREVEFTVYEPMCVEAIYSKVVQPLRVLLAGASYFDQWFRQLRDLQADSAVCVYSPNVIVQPERSSMKYCGAFSYDP